MSSELAEFNCSYYNKTNFNVSRKIKRAIDSTNISEMYLFGKNKKKMQTKKDIWALNAYLEFNDNMIREGNNEVKEFPITEEIVIKLIEFWTDRYKVNTIKVLLSIHNQIQAV
jgi:hypothetical protein